VRGVGIPCARGRYSRPFLRERSVFPCATGRYSLARGVCILCPHGRYSLCQRSVFGRLPDKKCAASRLLATKPCVRGRYRGAWWVRAGRGHLCHRSVRQRRHLARSPTAETIRSLRRGRYQRPLFAREVGIPCARGRYSRPFLRERSVIISRVLRLRGRPQGAWWSGRRRARYAQRGHRWARQDRVLQKRRMFVTFAPRSVWPEHAAAPLGVERRLRNAGKRRWFRALTA
jgi:hypothetical protein